MSDDQYDDDCCAIKGTASCEDSYVLTWQKETCSEPDAEYYSYKFLCMEPVNDTQEYLNMTS